MNRTSHGGIEKSTDDGTNLGGSTTRLNPLEPGPSVACNCRLAMDCLKTARPKGSFHVRHQKQQPNEQQRSNCELLSRDQGPKLRIGLRGRRQIPGQICFQLLPTSFDEPFACLRWHHRWPCPESLYLPVSPRAIVSSPYTSC